MITLDEILSIAEEIATALFEKLTDDGKLSVFDAVQLVILLVKLINKAIRS